MTPHLRSFRNAALALALAAMAGGFATVASTGAALADDKPKATTSKDSKAAAAKDKNAPGQACKAHKPGSDEYKACVQEQAKKGKKAQNTDKAKTTKAQAKKDKPPATKTN